MIVVNNNGSVPHAPFPNLGYLFTFPVLCSLQMGSYAEVFHEELDSYFLTIVISEVIPRGNILGPPGFEPRTPA